MQPLLYHELISWYRLVDPPADHVDEAASYHAALAAATVPGPETLLELGAGAGHNAFHMKRHFRCTLTDISEPMLGLSRELNPECEHIVGDMRSLRLDRTFDAVLVHDAVMYMLTEDDLRRAIATAFIHTRPGGAAVFAPDCVRENFVEHCGLLSCDEGARGLRGMEWQWDPDPSDDTYRVEYAFLLREEGGVKAVHDRHIEGLFARKTWVRLLGEAGYDVDTFERPLDDGDSDDVFICRRAQ